MGAEERLFRGQRVHVPIGRLLKAIACVVLGMPMNAVEKMLGIKAETLRARLQLLLRDPGWEMLDAGLEERFGLPRLEREEFCRAIVDGREFDAAAFRCWSKEFRRLDPADRAKMLRHIARIVGRPVKAILKETQ